MKISPLLIPCFILMFINCSSEDSTEPIPEKPELLASSICDGDTDIQAGSTTIALSFDKNIILKDQNRISLNDDQVEKASALYKDLKIEVTLDLETSYELKIPSGCVVGPTNGTTDDILIRFKTKAKSVIEGLVTKNASAQANNLYNFMKENYKNKSVSATMANVSWNFAEAEIVKTWTGKYPAMATMDYLHLYASPANWIDYTNISEIESWWNSNGIIAAGWHWNVPTSQSSLEYSFRTEETTFKAGNATMSGTWENEVVNADLEKISSNLKLLQEKNIPVVWRPLHEAAGSIYEPWNGSAWFWWGADGAENYRQLWIYLFDYFQQKGLDNLIWVWTSQGNDNLFYPGDEYVDIVGCDLYTKNASESAAMFKSLEQTYPGKMITLSECGAVANITEQWSAGARWSYFMPWYEYNATATGSSESHQHANKAWWTDAMNSENIITRDDMPSLK